jgi:transcription elongation factor GreA
VLEKIKRTLQKEIESLEYELRITLPKEIGKALEMGDLRENAEYKAALERQEFVRTRIGALKKRISNLSMINENSIPRAKIAYGSTARLINLDTDQQITYRLVLSEEADFEKGWISLSSPIGRALVGKQEGDCVTIQTPSGQKRFEIQQLKTLHDEEGEEEKSDPETNRKGRPPAGQQPPSPEKIES